MIAPYITFDRHLVQATVLSWGLNGFAPITQSVSLPVVTGHLFAPDEVDPEPYGRTSGQHSSFIYIAYVLFDLLHDEIRNDVL